MTFVMMQDIQGSETNPEITSPSDQCNNGLSALMFACQKQHYDLVKLLLDYGADVNLQSFKNWESAYGIAMFLNNPDIYLLWKKRYAVYMAVGEIIMISCIL